jgi:hypothetical protein
MIETAFLALHTIGCALACWYSLTGINACTRKTALAARASFAAIAVGAFAALFNPPTMDANGIASALVALGVGVGFMANRRVCVCLNCPQRPGPRRPSRMEWSELHHAQETTERQAGPHHGAPT